MPKGDAEKLRADLADPYARISNLLLEALAQAPLTGVEFRVLSFILRRTYGWEAGAEHTVRADVIAKREIAEGTGLSPNSVRYALAGLKAAHVITQEVAEVGGATRLGVNPQISDWGSTEAWDGFRTRFVGARDCGIYSRGIETYPPDRTLPPLPTDATPRGYIYTPPGGRPLPPPQAETPRAAGDCGKLSLEQQERTTRNGSDSSAREDWPAILTNNMTLRGAVHKSLRAENGQLRWSQVDVDNLVVFLARTAEDPNTDITEAELLAFLEAPETSPAMNENKLPQKYLERLLRLKQGATGAWSGTGRQGRATRLPRGQPESGLRKIPGLQLDAAGNPLFDAMTFEQLTMAGIHNIPVEHQETYRLALQSKDPYRQVKL